MDVTSDSVLSDTIDYIKKGWVIHPLSNPSDSGNSPGKKPLLPKWQYLTKTPDDIGAYIKKGCNIGLVCGKASGIDAIDFDLDLFHDELFNGLDFKTLGSSHTEGRGHLLFQHDGCVFSEKHHFIGIEYFGNNAEGAGSNLVLPPSKHYSGDIYKWNNPDIAPIKIPEKLKQNMLKLFKKEDELHDYFKKCRFCFTKGSKKYDKTDPRSKGLWDRPDTVAVHGTDGRAAVIAIMGELRNVGCPDELLHMTCKRIFGKDYTYNETAEALKHIKAIPPKCDTLRTQLNVECDGCVWRHAEQPKEEPKKDICQTCKECLFKPRGGVGGCRNPLNEDEKHKKKPVTYDLPICEHFKQPEEIAYKTKNNNEEVSASSIALQVLEKYPVITLIDNPDEMYYYKDGVYLYGAENKIRAYTQTLLDCESKKTIIQEVVYYIQNETFIERKKINSQKHLINLKNGCYNLITRKLEPHSPTHYSTCQINIEYKPSATCPEISRFLCEVLRPRDIALIIQAIGYCLVPDYSIQKAILLNGSGLNGKGTLGRLMAAAFGDQNISSESLKALNTDKFSASNLYGKLINIDMDLTSEAVHEDSVFKKLTGGDMIPAERKFQNRFEFRNIARLFFGCNDIPQHKKGGYAYYRRWIIVDFPNKFDGDLENKDLDNKLKTPEELSGFLNLCLEGLHWLLETKTFFYDKTPEEVGEEYLLKSNSVMAFMKECTTPADDYVRTADLYQAYLHWGKITGLKKTEPANIFGQLLKSGGYNQVRPYVDGKQIMAYEGFIIDLEKTTKLEKDALLNKNQEAYTHWFRKHSATTQLNDNDGAEAQQEEISWVSRVAPQIIHNIITLCTKTPNISDNDIVEQISCDYLEGNPTYYTYKGDNIPKNDKLRPKKSLSRDQVEQPLKIIGLLKSEYDSINKPTSKDDFQRLKETMSLKITTAFDTKAPTKYIEQYAQSRGWE